jgi:uncharacterized surface protein with fasciclin (FAS1) repeats
MDPAALANVLLYHVVPGRIMSDELKDMTSLTTVSGEDLIVTVDNATDDISVDNATVIEADIEASNGVIHVIDDVLIPPVQDQDIVEIAAGDERFGTLVTALQEAL